MPTSAETIYTVPASYTVVVRSIQALNNNSSSSSFNLYLTASGGSTGPLFYISSFPAYDFSTWEGRAVLNAGDIIGAVAGESGILITISGYLLTG